MIATLSSEKTGPIELGEVEIEAWGAVSGLGELISDITVLPPARCEVTAWREGDDGHVELGVATNASWLPIIQAICKLPAAKYRITAWPLVRGEYRETRFGDGVAPAAGEPIGRVIL